MKYFLSFFLLTLTNFLFAQNDPKEIISGMKPNAIYLSGTIELEPWIFYERIFKKSNAIEIGFGKRWSDRQESGLSKKTDQAQFYEGNIFMGAYKKYFNFHPSKHPFYISTLLFYKNYYFDKVPINHINASPPILGGGYYENCQIRSSQKQVYGIKFLLGRRFNFNLTNSLLLVLDVYSGFGLRQRVFTDLVYAYGETNTSSTSCNCSPYPEPKKENLIEEIPSIHLGGKIGISF